jgi:hypothetical protein
MRILLASYGGAHVRTIVPLLSLLAEKGHHVIPLALTTAVNTYRRLGIAHKRITDVVAVDADIRRYAAPLLAAHHNPEAGISLEESTAYLGASMRDLITQYGEDEAFQRYRTHGLNAFEPMKLAQSILKQTAADLVVSTCSPRLERALLAAAVDAGVPSVCMVALFPLIGMSYLSKPDNGHWAFVGNARFKNQLVAHGRPAESIRIIGNPAFDLLQPKGGASRRLSLRQARSLSPDACVVLWAEQPEPASNAGWPETVRASLCRLGKQDRNLVPYIRLHPSSQIGQTLELATGVELSSRAEDAVDALLTADIVVTATSTIGYEAALMGKDVIIVRGSHYDAYADYCEEDGVMVIEDYQQLHGAIHAYRSHAETARRIRRYREALPKPGHFTQDAVESILALCADTNSQS